MECRITSISGKHFRLVGLRRLTGLSLTVTGIWEVDNGLSTLTAQEPNDDLKQLGEVIQDDFKKRIALAKGQNTGNEAALVKTKQTNKTVENELLEPNKLVPYRPNVFGLDQARRDCRFEMIKIVREVSGPRLWLSKCSRFSGGCSHTRPTSCH